MSIWPRAIKVLKVGILAVAASALLLSPAWAYKPVKIKKRVDAASPLVQPAKQPNLNLPAVSPNALPNSQGKTLGNPGAVPPTIKPQGALGTAGAPPLPKSGIVGPNQMPLPNPSALQGKPGDSSAMATGRRTYEPIIIRKRVDKNSPASEGAVGPNMLGKAGIVGPTDIQSKSGPSPLAMNAEESVAGAKELQGKAGMSLPGSNKMEPPEEDPEDPPLQTLPSPGAEKGLSFGGGPGPQEAPTLGK